MTKPIPTTAPKVLIKSADNKFATPQDLSVLIAPGDNSLSIDPISGKLLGAALTPVNDQTDSGFFDIGNMRIQTGREGGGNAGTRTITLPAPFANTNYRITYGADYNADNLVRSVNTASKTTTIFRARVQHQQGGSDTAFDWIAIGRKP